MVSRMVLKVLPQIKCVRLLKKDLPIITNVSVEETSFDNGKMYVAWSKPTELDTILIPGPYQYRINRKDNSRGNNFTERETYYNLNDTIFEDTPFKYPRFSI